MRYADSDFGRQLELMEQEGMKREDLAPSTLFLAALYGPCGDLVFGMALRYVQGLSISDVGSGRRRR